MMSEQFVSILQSLTGHLRRQTNLIREMECKCPRFQEIRWIGTHRVLKFFTGSSRRRNKILAHLEAKAPHLVPSPLWWIHCAALEAYLRRIERLMRELQGKEVRSLALYWLMLWSVSHFPSDISS